MKGFTLWFTGPNRSDRTYLARMIEENLLERGIKVELIEEEGSGRELFQGLGDTPDERETAANRAAAVSTMLTRNDVISIVSVDSPARAAREEIRERLDRFYEVYVKSGAGDEPFEEPEKPEVVADLEGDGEDACAGAVVRTLELLKLIPADETIGEYSGDEEEKITKRLKDLGYI